MSVGPGGPNQPQNVGADYGVQVLGSANSPEIILPTDVETKSVLVIAPNGNTGAVYLGWDDQVTSSNGTPLTPGNGVSFDIDTFEQPLWAVAPNANDEVRFIATA